LVVKTERRALDPGMKGVNTETFYGDYKEIDGVKQPTKVVVHQDGKKFLDTEVTEVKFFDKLEESLFMKP
jgi:hypothetical protein